MNSTLVCVCRAYMCLHLCEWTNCLDTIRNRWSILFGCFFFFFFLERIKHAALLLDSLLSFIHSFIRLVAVWFYVLFRKISFFFFCWCFANIFNQILCGIKCVVALRYRVCLNCFLLRLHKMVEFLASVAITIKWVRLLWRVDRYTNTLYYPLPRLNAWCESGIKLVVSMHTRVNSNHFRVLLFLDDESFDILWDASWLNLFSYTCQLVYFNPFNIFLPTIAGDLCFTVLYYMFCAWEDMYNT